MTTTERAQEIREIQLEMRAKYHTVDWPEPVMEPIYFGRFDKNPVENRLLIMDKNTGAQYDIVSDRYELIPHEIAAYNLLKALPEELGTPKLNFKLWQDGARFRLEASFPDIGNFEVKPGDPVEPKVIQTNSLDRSTFYGLEFGATELVCTNGLVAYRKKSDTARRHIYGAQDIEEISTGIKTELENFTEQVGIWQRWNELNVPNIEEMIQYVGSMDFSEAEHAKLLALPLLNYENRTLASIVNSGKATLWTLNSAATQYAAWEVNSEQRRYSLESNIARNITKLGEKLAA